MKGQLELKEYEKAVGLIVAENYKKAEVFRKFGIDFCCGGDKTLQEACQDLNLDQDALLDELHAVAFLEDTDDENFNEWPLEQLIDYIVDVHHDYVKQTVPIIKQYIQKVLNDHGDDVPHLEEIATHFEVFADEMITHLQKEELLLFPYLKELQAALDGKGLSPIKELGMIEYPINVMLKEHHEAGDELKAIERLTDAFKPPVDACETQKVCYNMLQNFEEDLMIHIHLENNILFPRAIELEKAILAQQ